MLIAIIFLSFLSYTFQLYTPEILAKIPPVDFCLADAKKKHVYYYLFKSSSQTTAIVLNENYILPEDDKKLPMKILIHGFTSNVTSPWYKEMKKAYFKKGPHNIVYVDWSVEANKTFAVSAANIKPVGEYIADFIMSIKVPLENVHIIGHSLGAHLAGFIGKNLFAKMGNKVARITATDAAGPGFEPAGPEARLCKYDATFVDAIHTDIGYFGIWKPIGHVDFYVNSGQHQPGCPQRKENENCSHARSNEYFIESINATGITAKPAKVGEAGKIVLRNKGDDVVFGDAVDTTARGLYLLDTHAMTPFLISKKKKKV